MSDELEAVKAVVIHPITAGTATLGVIGWLANKIYSGIGRRITSIETASKDGLYAAAREMDERKRVESKLFDLLRDHEEKDTQRFAEQNTANRDRHDELMALIGDLREDIAGLKR